MKAARAKVVKGRIVTRARFPEGAKLVLVEQQDQTPVVLSPDDEEAILRGLATIRAGRGISLEQFRAVLRRL